MADTVRPAMTPSVWGKVLKAADETVQKAGDSMILRVDDETLIIPPHRLKVATAALCLIGYFTWEMVDALEECLSDWEAEAGDWRIDPSGAGKAQRRVYAAASAAIDRIQALLPPRET